MIAPIPLIMVSGEDFAPKTNVSVNDLISQLIDPRRYDSF
jgi:hypothetical protein